MPFGELKPEKPKPKPRTYIPSGLVIPAKFHRLLHWMISTWMSAYKKAAERTNKNGQPCKTYFDYQDAELLLAMVEKEIN